jgi:hypothetical protein
VDRRADHRRVEDVLHRDRLAVEDRGRVELRIGPGADRDLGEILRPRAVRVHVGLGDHRVRRVGATGAERHVELADGVAVLGGGERAWPRGTADAEHGLAHPRLDRGRGAPHHAGRTGAAEVDDVGHPRPEAQVLGRRRRHMLWRLAELLTDEQAVDVRRLQPRVGNRECGGVGHQAERRLGGGRALRRQLADPDDGPERVASASHSDLTGCGSPTRRRLGPAGR